MKDTITNTLINIKVEKIQSTLDSLQNSKSLDQLKYRAVEQQENINQVREFYHDAFVDLLWLIGLLFTVIGVLIPLISGYFQRKNLQDFANSIKKELESKFEEKIIAIQNLYDEEIKKINLEFKNKGDELELDRLNAKKQMASHVFFVKASMFQSLMTYDEAYRHYMISTNNWIQLNDISSLKAAMRGISETLAEIDVKTFKLIDTETNEKYSLKKFVLKIRELNNSELLNNQFFKKITEYLDKLD